MGPMMNGPQTPEPLTPDELVLRLKQERDHWRFEHQRMVAFYDTQVGTPCEQIRHAQEVEALNERVETLVDAIDKLNFDIQKRGGLAEIDDRNAKAQLYDLDQIGIETRMEGMTDLMDARAKIVTLQELHASGKSRLEQVAVAYVQQQKEIASLRAKLDGEPCNDDFQREAAEMSAKAEECMKIKDEALGHAAAMSNDLTAMGEKLEALLDALQEANTRADIYQKLSTSAYVELTRRNAVIADVEATRTPLFLEPEEQEWP
jgi:chromosome segregation ATPase